MKLTANQIEKLNKMIESIRSIHRVDDQDKDAHLADDMEPFVIYAEEFLFELGAIDKKIF